MTPALPRAWRRGTIARVSTNLPELIELARQGDAEALRLLVRALQAERAPAAVLLDLARADQGSLRCAAIFGAVGRPEPELRDALAALADDPLPDVRRSLAEALAAISGWPLDAAVQRLLGDDDDLIRQAAARAARGRPALENALLQRLADDEEWRVRRAAAEALGDGSPRAVLPALAQALGSDKDRDVAEACASSIEHHLDRLGAYPADWPRPRLRILEEAQRHVSVGRCPRLAAWLEERVAQDVDVEQLRELGTVLTVEAEAGRLPHAHQVDTVCAAVHAVLTGAAPRAVVLLGEPGAGKTAIVHELTHRLRHDPSGPWYVLQVAPADLLAGTSWLGEWQTKARNLVQSIRAPRRVVLYIPNLEELSDTGRTSQSDSNVATALAPAIERGDIAVIGESTPEAFRTGLGRVGSLRRLFHAVEVREPSLAQTRAILQAVRDEAGADVPGPVLDRLVELADFYLTGTAQPGRTVGLLRRVLGAAAGRDGPITDRDVLNTLSTSTGIPVDFLDDAVPLDRAAVRGFFEQRVMGQPEAVDAVVDLVTLVKAGLTDPGKPFGVLLFVGPTGVGKTELARALAELLFGDPGRMIRLDMSEFSTYDAHERLIGTGARPGLLTAAVRERPFAVLLFDEFEKAHPNIFDLCLQVFDAGRLTDQRGRTADFRRTIIILTSNLGATLAREGPGFRPAPPTAPSLDRDATLRELGRWFRPEFLNRLDRVVTFRALAAETAEKIARREVAHVLARSGLARRKLDVDVEPAVFTLLLREGYSPTFGARPLKRTVERLILLPVARTIAAGGVPAGALLRLLVRNGQVAVEVADADKGDAEALPAVEDNARTGRVRPPAQARVDKLVKQLADLRSQAAPLAARKSELITRQAAAGFWDDPDDARRAQDEIYRLDGVFAMLDDLERAVHSETEASRRQPPAHPAQLHDRLDALVSRARHLEFLVSCRTARALGDAFVSLTLVASRGAGLDAVAKLAEMYAALARRRGLEVQVLDDRRGGTPAEDTLTLLVYGAGAHALLSGEAGLHQVTLGKGKSPGGRVRATDRDVVRVDVLPVPPGDPLGQDEIRCEVRNLDAVQGRLLKKPRYDVHLLHVPSLTAVRAWTDGSRSQALERLRPLLAARVESARNAGSDANAPAFIRRYNLGPAPLVRDLRTHRSTGRLDRVLEGHLDPFLGPLTESDPG